MSDLKDYAEKAYRILHKEGTSAETNYGRSKRIITSFFNSSEENYFETVISRLTLIDSYYSTQINSKRLFGIDEIAEKIVHISNQSDDELRMKCYKFLQSPLDSGGIKDLFEQEHYGIHKTGEPAGQASSLISKYLYFLMSSNFPIYDTLAVSSYNKIKSKYNFDLPELKKEFDVSYFDSLKQLNILSKIEHFGKLDNLLWLVGKITQGSLSIIIDRDSYEKIAKRAKVVEKMASLKGQRGKKKKRKNGESPDGIIRDYIRNSQNLNEVFGGDEYLIEFFTFSMQFSDK
ncbi:MAG: hypothetical protein WCK92_07965 [Bacteroidota bacterium]